MSSEKKHNLIVETPIKVIKILRNYRKYEVLCLNILITANLNSRMISN